MNPLEALDMIVDYVQNPGPDEQRFSDAERYLVATLKGKIRPRLAVLVERRTPTPKSKPKKLA